VSYRIDAQTRDRGRHSFWRHRGGRTTTVPEFAVELEMSVEDSWKVGER
jgi:hypothetical protein